LKNPTSTRDLRRKIVSHVSRRIVWLIAGALVISAAGLLMVRSLAPGLPHTETTDVQPDVPAADVSTPEADAVIAKPSGRPASQSPASAPASGTHEQQRTTRSDPGRPADSNPSRLATESTLLFGDEVNVEAVGSILRTDRFDEMLQAMLDEAQTDADASDLTDTYASSISAQVGTATSLRLDRLACGLRLCAATFSDGDEATWTAWTENFQADPQTPSNVFVEHAVALENGAALRRIIFSTDPTTAGVAGLITVGQ
jgi:hypothetical protein